MRQLSERQFVESSSAISFMAVHCFLQVSLPLTVSDVCLRKMPSMRHHGVMYSNDVSIDSRGETWNVEMKTCVHIETLVFVSRLPVIAFIGSDRVSILSIPIFLCGISDPIMSPHFLMHPSQPRLKWPHVNAHYSRGQILFQSQQNAEVQWNVFNFEEKRSFYVVHGQTSIIVKGYERWMVCRGLIFDLRSFPGIFW